MNDKRINEQYKLLEDVNNKNIYFVESDKSYGYITQGSENNLISSLSFKNFKIDPNELEDSEGNTMIKVYVLSERARDILNSELRNNDNCDFWEKVLEIEAAFSKNASDFLKFRGDLAECLFLHIEGGEKNLKEDSTDIILDGNLIEIKSFSLNSREIMISNQQVHNIVQTFAVGIVVDNLNGMTILELAEKLEGNEFFKKYINEKYGETYLGKYLKYSVSYKNVFEITDFIKTLKMNKAIIEAKVKLP